MNFGVSRLPRYPGVGCSIVNNAVSCICTAGIGQNGTYSFPTLNL